MHLRRTSLAVAAAVTVAACGSGDEADAPDAATATAATDPSSPERSAPAPAPSEPDDAGGEPFAVEQIESSPADPVRSGLDAWFDQSFGQLPEPEVDPGELRSGGPPPDGIPPVDEPRFLRAGDVDFLADNEPVLALEIGGEARAYPVQVLTWHEIVNDTLGDVPVSVTYCPLCNSAVAYDRRLPDGRIVDFGTSGLLWNSALVMYDRQTETLWSHFTGSGIIGELTGVELDVFPLATVAWSTWRDANPDGLVLSRQTGFDREYGRNPYPGYDDVDGVPFLFEGDVDGRFTAMTRIVGVELDRDALGVPLVALERQRVIGTELAGTDLVVWWTPGTASALDTASIESGTDVGATGVFVPTIDDMPLTFRPDGDGAFVDDRTESTWNVLGQAVDGPLAGRTLEAVAHVDTFWFAWSTFRPDTDVVTG
jgi:hypothetical protein